MKKLALSLAVVAASSAYVWNQWGSDPNAAALGLSPADAVTSLDSEASPDPQPTGAIATPKAPPAAADAAPALPAPPAADVAPTTKAEPAAVILPAPFVIDRPVPPAPPITADAAPAPAAPSPAAPAVVVTSMPAPAEPAPAPAEAAATAVTPDPLPPRPRPRPHLTADTMPLAMNVSMTVAARGGYADGTFTGPSVDAYYGMVQIQAIVRSGKLVSIKVLQYPSDRRTSVSINRQALPMLRDEAVTAQSAEVDIVSGATLTSQAFIRSLRGALKQATA